MKPLRLKIKGINSFIEEQTIDFEKLLENGLFGIFGPTGSGKSTVIDAITIALYGETARFEGGRTKVFLNSLSDTGWVSFEFELKIDGKTVLYKAERGYKKKDDTQSVTKAVFTSEVDGQTQVICDKPREMNEAVENILGLSYKDFTRAVVLPQGKFSRFLLLANVERREMLERLFDLEKYGEKLSQVIVKENRRLIGEIRDADIKLGMYGDISIEKLEALEEKLLLSNKEYAEKKEKAEKFSTELVQKQILQKNAVDYAQSKSKLDNLIKQKPEIDADRVFIEKAKKANSLFPVFSALKNDKEKIEKDSGDLAKQEAEFKIAGEELILAEKENAQISEEVETKGSELNQKIARAKQALELEEKTQVINQEKINLQIKYKKLKSEFDKNSLDLEKAQAELEKLKIKENEHNILIEKNRVKPEYREFIEFAVELTQKNTDWAKAFEKICAELSAVQKQMEKNQTESQKIAKDLERSKSTWANYIKEYERTQNSKPIEAEKLQKLREEISEKTIKGQALARNFSTYTKAFTEKEQICQKLCEINEKIKISESESQKLTEDIQGISFDVENGKRRAIASELAKTLSAGESCPVCGSVHHPSPACGDERELTDLEEKLNALKIQGISKEQEKNQLILTRERFLEVSERLKNEIAGYGEEISNFNEKIYFEEVEAKKQYLENMEKAENHWTLKLKEFEKQISGERETVKIFETSAEFYEKEKNRLKEELELKSLEHKEKEKMSQEVFIELAEIKSKNPNIDFLAESKKIKEMDINFSKVTDEMKEISALKASKEPQIKILESLLISLKSEIDELIIIGREKGTQIESYAAQIKAITGDKAPEVFLEESERELKAINDKRQKAAYVLNLHKEKTAGLHSSITSLKSGLQVLSKVYEEKLDKFNSDIAEWGDVERFLSFVIDENLIKKRQSIVDEFDKNITIITDTVKNLEVKSEGIDLEKISGEIEYLKENIKIISEEVQGLKESMILLEREIKKLKEDLAAVGDLIQEKNALSKRQGYVNELAKLFEGKRFVDYIAKRHLRFIAAEASARLKTMTGGRLAMELDETDFVIRDDSCGGAMRSPKTLSGGETFMASLCLALALSGKVQLKNKAGLEFFFLDEGFGSLDPGALDIVMNVLTELKGQNINVGVISHVEEMKERIGDRLLISPPVYGYIGSQVETR